MSSIHNASYVAFCANRKCRKEEAIVSGAACFLSPLHGTDVILRVHAGMTSPLTMTFTSNLFLKVAMEDNEASLVQW